MQKWSHYLRRQGQLESFHKSGHFKLLPLLIGGEDWPLGGGPLGHQPALGAVFNRFFLMRAPSSPSPLLFINKLLVFFWIS